MLIFKIPNTYENVGRLSQVDVTFQNEVIEFNLALYTRQHIKNTEKLFDIFNLYLSTLEQEKQLELFNLFKKIKEIIDNVITLKKLNKILRGLIKEVFEILDFKSLKRLISLNNLFKYPLEIKDTINLEDVGYENVENRTYLKNHYLDLVALTILLKPLIPILGYYIWILKSENDSIFREKNALSLLSDSNIIELNPWKKLELYIEYSLENEDEQESAIFSGIGSEELPEWILSRLLIKKLLTYEPSNDENIVSNIYHNFNSTVKGINKLFKNSIRDKPDDSGHKQGDDNLSNIEGYKIKKSISDGDIIIYENFLYNNTHLAKLIDFSIPDEKIDICLSNIGTEQSFHIEEENLTITQWVFSLIISPRVIPLLSKITLLKLFANTQALLWHWGFNELAIILIAKSEYNFINSKNTNIRIEKEYIEKFEKIWKYSPKQKEKEMVNSRQYNCAALAVDQISKNIFYSDWYSNGPKELENLCKLDGRGTLIPSDTIKNNICQLLLKINNLMELKNESI